MKNQQMKLLLRLNEHRKLWESNREIETAGVDYYQVIGSSYKIPSHYKIPISYANKFFKLGIMIDPRNAFLKEIAAESLKENVLAILGWKIIRFYKDEIDEDIDSCVSEIYQDLVYSFLDHDLTYSNTV
jgi:hypothetical protein